MTEPRRDPAASPRSRAWLGALAIVLITVIAYLPAINAGFIWDDDSYVTENPLLRDLDGLARIWVPRETPQYYPVVFTSFWIEYQLWELEPMGYHLVNVLLHGMNAVLLWFVLARLRVPGAWLIGAVFALHPIHVESVAWIAERKNVLSMSFFLLAAMAYIRFDPMGDSPRVRVKPGENRERWGWYGAALVLFILALLSKTVTCSLPAALILVMLWRRASITPRRLVPLVPMFIIGLILALNTAVLEREHVGAVGEDFQHGPLTRTLIASRALLFYPGKILWPEPLMFVYPRWEIDPSSSLHYLPLVACLAIGGMLMWLLVKGVRGPFVAAAFYAGTILPALGLFNVYPHLYSFVADHFAYHASAGVLALVIGGAAHLMRRPAMLRVAGAAVLVVLFALTWLHATTFHDAETVYRDTLAKNPDAWMAHNNLSSIVLNRADAAMQMNRPEDAAQLAREAESHALAAIILRPQNHPSHSNLSEALRLQQDHEAALAAIDDAVALLPEFAEYHWKRARLLLAMNRPDEAIESFEAAADRLPDDPSYRRDLARALLAQQRLDEAAAQFERVLSLDANDFESLRTLAEIRNQQQRYAEADRLYERALQAAPGIEEEVQIVVRLIRFLSTCPDESLRDHDLAISLAQQLVELSGRRDPSAIGIAAWAYAEAGHHEEAIQLAQHAIGLAEAAGQSELAESLRQQLEEHRAAMEERGPR